MADLKTMVEKGNFAEVASYEAEAKSPQDVYCVFSSFLSLGQASKAMEYLLAHRALLWAWKPMLTMKADFETRFLLGEFDEAYDDLDYFANLPYVSQEVEEALRAYPKRIRLEETGRRGRPAFDEEEIHKILRLERDPATLLAYLNALKKSDLMPYIEDLHTLLEDKDVHDDVKSYTIMLLAAHHDDTAVSFFKGGKKFTLIPAEVRMPYSGKDYARARGIVMNLPEVSLRELSGEILDQYVIALFPEEYTCSLADEELALAFTYISNRYLGRKEAEMNANARLEANAMEETISRLSPLTL